MGCKFCDRNDELNAEMTWCCSLNGFDVFLVNDQWYRGRSIVAPTLHKKRLTDLDDAEQTNLARTIVCLHRAINSVLSPDNINTMILGDHAEHLHVHVVPKFRHGPDYGKCFQIAPDSTRAANKLDLSGLSEQLKLHMFG